MKGDPLESATAKLNWANNQLKQLNVELGQAKGFLFNREADELVIYASMPHELFIRLSIMAGEVIYHARSALEHAVWEMVPAADRSKTTGFPVYSVESGVKDRDYDSKGIKMIKGISPAAQTIIKGAQPFGPDHAHPLYILHELWNRDKHRLLNTVVAYPQVFGLLYFFPDGRMDGSQFVTVPPDVKDGTELFRAPHPGPGVEVKGEGAVSSVVFDDGLVKGQPVSEVLDKLLHFAESVISDLAKTI